MATSEIERLLTSWAIAWSSKDSSNDPERVLALFVASASHRLGGSHCCEEYGT